MEKSLDKCRNCGNELPQHMNPVIKLKICDECLYKINRKNITDLLSTIRVDFDNK